MNRFAYARPGSLEAARKLLGESSPAYAGGIDLLDRMKEGIAAPERVVDLKGGALDDRIEEVGGALRIGPLATLTKVAADETVRRRFPALAESAGEAAIPQVRNVATIAGNLCQRPRCWYFRSAEHRCLKKGGPACFAQDGENRFHAIFANEPCAIVHPSNVAPALVAHGAAFRVLPAGKETTTDVPASHFFLPPERRIDGENVLEAGDLITEIRLPLPAGERRSAYLEIREKQTFDWALVAAAVDLGIADGKVASPRIVLGQVAPVPWRAEAAEAAIEGKVLTEELAGQAGEAAAEGATPLAQNAYKVKLVPVVVARALLRAAGR
jgi:xanthine dehydrogenase YagS FAD-binding subunit